MAIEQLWGATLGMWEIGILRIYLRVAYLNMHLHAKHCSNLSDTLVIDDGFISPYVPLSMFQPYVTCFNPIFPSVGDSSTAGSSLFPEPSRPFTIG